MNIIELLMVEHASLRLHFRFVREKSSDLIFEVEDFVRNCHAKVEDEVVFPRLKQMLASKEEQLVKVLSRIEADHKLIEMIGEQIKNSTAQAETEMLRKRIMLYANTVESHNSSEESLIFQYWKTTEEESREIISKAKNIIEQFGRERYFRITGISERLFDVV
ncbi:MAG: hemerythrin domain-containing protein [Thaumarchaeota archaeon]|nr:hemerythrin domain-containing protein [Nitrososphaerota archaeon]